MEMTAIRQRQLSLTIILLCQLVTIHSTIATTNDADYHCENFCLLRTRGKQGDKGEQGGKGSSGSKGENGFPGPSGQHGLQGLRGVAGPPGPRGPPGYTGIHGSEGSAGKTGEIGLPGKKGDKGDTGSQGYHGLDGLIGPAGVPGIPGQPGTPGQKGEHGLPGYKGVRGPQGPEGHISQSSMTPFLHPIKTKIKSLDKEVHNIKEKLMAHQTSSRAIACHMYGNGTQGTFENGTVVTYWNSSSGVMTDEITYSNGYITVLMEGFYYVYAQLWYDAQRQQYKTGFYIYHNNDVIGEVYTHDGDPRSRDKTQYGGFVRFLNKGDRLSVQLSHTAMYEFYFPYTVFGCFRL